MWGSKGKETGYYMAELVDFISHTVCVIYKGSYMSAHASLKVNELGKCDIMRGFYVFFCLAFAMPMVTCWERADLLALV